MTQGFPSPAAPYPPGHPVPLPMGAAGVRRAVGEARAEIALQRVTRGPWPFLSACLAPKPAGAVWEKPNVSRRSWPPSSGPWVTRRELAGATVLPDPHRALLGHPGLRSSPGKEAKDPSDLEEGREVGSHPRLTSPCSLQNLPCHRAPALPVGICAASQYSATLRGFLLLCGWS